MADTNKMKNDQIIRDSINSRALIGAESDSIAKSLGGSQRRKDKYDEEQRIKRDLQRGLVKGADPYDNTPGGSKVPKDKLMSLTNGAYTATLLEKILKASDNSQFQNSTLKFQEQALNYMQTISADVKSLVEYLKPKAVEQQEDEDNELKMEMTNMAKALSSLDVEGIAREIGKSIYSKMDSGGYGDLVKTMYQSLKDTIQGGEFSQMVKGMIQNTMLSQLPKEWQQNIQQFRDDPVKLMQLQLNKLGRSDNNVIRDIFGSFIRREKPNTELQEKKVDLSAKAMFDNKFYMSVTKVIPEQLYRIVAALEGHEIRAFDWDKQDYLTATEIWAKAHKNNMAASPEAIQRRVMDIFSYSFEQMAEGPGAGNLRTMFQVDDKGKLLKDQVTGHVQFRNNRVKHILTQMVKSGLDVDALRYASPEIILKEIDVKWKDDSERGSILQDIFMIQTMFRKIDFGDRTDLISDVFDLRSDINNQVRDNSADFLTAQETGIIERIMYNPNLTAEQKKDLLASTNKKGIHVWGNFGGSGGNNNGGSGSGGGGSLPPIFGPNTTTDTNGILNTLNQASPRQLNDKELNDARTLFDDFVAGKASNRNIKKIIPVSERDKYLAKLNDMYGMGAIDDDQFKRMSTVNTADDLRGVDADMFKHGGLKVKLAHQLYGILTDAGFTAESRAARLGISVEEAKAQGYVGNAWELMKVIDIRNGEAYVNKNLLSKYNMNYLTDDGIEYIKKEGRRRQRSVLGTGSIDQQISKTLSGIFGDPKIANKAGMALGGAAGLGIHKLLKSAGVMQDPRFGWLLGGVGAGLMTMERSRNFIDNVFGPAGDVKGANGFTNKEIFMAKAMTKYLPMIGVGGKTAQAIIKATSAFGPLGKAFGMIAGPIIGFGMGKAASSLLEKGRDWLFNPDRDKNSKLGKLASFLKEIPGVKKLFALSDDRIDEEVTLDALKQTLSYFKARDIELKSKGQPQMYSEKIKAIEIAIPQIEGHIRTIKNEYAQEDKEDGPGVNHDKINRARDEINKILTDLKEKLGDEGTDIFQRYEEEQKDMRDTQNRMRSASNANYNKIGEERRERVSEILGKYFEADDERARSLREFLSGEGDSIADLISDNELRQRFDTIVYKHSLGDDVKDEYNKWLEDFKAKDPTGYDNFVELTQSGADRARHMEEAKAEIKRYLIDEEHFQGSEAELNDQAERRMMQSIGHKSFGRMAKDLFGSTVAESWAKFAGRINGVDVEDVVKEKQNRSFVDAMNRGNIVESNRKNDEYLAAAEAASREAENARLASERERQEAAAEAAAYRKESLKEMLETYRSQNGRATKNAVKAFWNQNYKLDGMQGLSKQEVEDFLKEYNAGGKGTEPVKMKQMEKLKFASGESLGIAGCSVAAIINALVYMGLDAPEPDTLIGIANKYLTKDGGVTSDFFLEVAKNLGIKASIYNNKENVFTVDVFKQFTVGKDNGLICLLKNQFSSGYHYVTIKSVSGRKLVVDDPETKGLTQTTAAEIVSRVVEIVSLQTITQTSITEETTMDPTKAGTTLSSGARQTGSSIKQVAKDAIADVASAAINKISGGATKALGKWAGLVEALKNAVFNVRIVDDFTLPLKMGDAEAALAVSRMQAAAASASGASATKYVQAIKKMMMNKDVQNEMNESDLMQETIINGGLVAGGSTGAGGRGSGTIGNGKPGGTWVDAIKQDTNRVVEKLSLGDKVKKLALGGLMGATGLMHGFIGKKVTGPMLGMAHNLLNIAQGNMFGEIKEEDKVAKYDEEGNLVEKSKYRDLSGTMRNLKDSLTFVKGAAAAHGLVGKVVNSGLKLAAKSKIDVIADIGKSMTEPGAAKGMVSKFIKLVKMGLVDFPMFIAKKLMSIPKLTQMMGATGFNDFVGFIVGKIQKVAAFIGKKLLPALSAKAGKTFAGKGLLKKIIGKIPGGLLIMAATQLIPAAITGWTKAGEFLGKKKDEEITFDDRLSCMLAKIIYDCGPDILVGLITIGQPWAALGGDLLIAAWRACFSFDDFMKSMKSGMVKSENGTALKKAEDEIVEGTDKAVDKGDDQAIKDGEKVVDKVANAPETNTVVVAGKDGKQTTDTTSVGGTISSTQTMLDNNVSFVQRLGGRPSPVTSGWGSPVDGTPFVTSVYGERNVRDNPKASKFHKGIDIRGRLGAPVYAAKAGKVSGSNQSSGKIAITHGDGTQTRYLHLNTRLVDVGQDVAQGQLIGYVGKIGADGTSNNRMGPHLHFEILKKGEHLDPFIEFGLSKKQLKLPGNGGNTSNSAENIAYVEQHQWLNNMAKTKTADNNKPSTAKPVVTTNTEAGGPEVQPHNSNYSSNNTTINNNNLQLERYVRSLDAKFNQMIDLLSKLVNISQENANNVLSDAMAPARI